MPTASKNTTAVFGGKGVSNDIGSATSDGEINLEISLPVAKAASAWVKTDSDTAACNLTAGHGIVTGKVDVYWTGGSRYGVDCTVSTNALALDLGSGDAYPATANATVVIAQQVTITFNLVSTALKFLALVNKNISDTTGKVSADIQTSAPASLVRYLLPYEKVAGGLAAIVDVANGDTNPISGTAATIRASNSSITYAATLLAYALYDATP